MYNLITGVPDMVPGITVDSNTINLNGNNVTLTLRWGEPFNNFDPIVNYIVSCSGDVRCPPNFTTTDNRKVISNLTPMTNYEFSVVAVNSIGEGKAGVLSYTTPPGEIKDAFVHEYITCSINKPQSKLKGYTYVCYTHTMKKWYTQVYCM